MLGRILIGSAALCLALGAYAGWRMTRVVEARTPELRDEIAHGFEWAGFREAAAAREGSNSKASTTPAVIEVGKLERPPDSGSRRAQPIEADALALEAMPEPASAKATAAPEVIFEALRPAASQAELVEFVEELRNDDKPGNAMQALDRLVDAGPSALPELERALLSPDEQQRSLAAVLCARIEGHQPTPVLAQVLFDLLTPAPGKSYSQVTDRCSIGDAGRAGWDERRCAYSALARDGALFAYVETDLIARLSQSASPARFDAACLLARQHSARGYEAALRVLVEHLRDNSWADDAAIAMRQLAHEGVHALPQVESALSGADAQQARLLAHFLARFAPDHPAAHASTARELALLGFDRGDMLADELSTH